MGGGGEKSALGSVDDRRGWSLGIPDGRKQMLLCNERLRAADRTFQRHSGRSIWERRNVLFSSYEQIISRLTTGTRVLSVSIFHRHPTPSFIPPFGPVYHRFVVIDSRDSEALISDVREKAGQPEKAISCDWFFFFLVFGNRIELDVQKERSKVSRTRSKFHRVAFS